MENRQRGVSSVEFVLLLPLLLLIIFIIIEFSIIMFDKAVITNASREGARRGILMATPRTTEAEITGTVNTYCAANLISFVSPRPAPATAVSSTCGATGQYITVSVTYPYTFFVVPQFSGVLPPSLTLTGVSVMRCE